MKFQDVVDAWHVAPLDAIHPSRATSEVAYAASGAAQAHELAGLLPKGRIVDFGCGDGRVASPLRRLGFDVVAVDSSARMIEALHARDPEVSTLVSDGSDLAEQLGTKAAAVFCLAVLIHHDYDSCRQTLINLRRAVRKGGLMVLDWPTSEHPSERKSWIGVTTWSPARQAELAAEVGMVSVPTRTSWTVWRAA